MTAIVYIGLIVVAIGGARVFAWLFLDDDGKGGE